MTTVITPEQGINIARTLAKHSGGKKRAGFRQVAQTEEQRLQAEIDRIQAQAEKERQRVQAEREFRRTHTPSNAQAMLKVARATFGLTAGA